MAQSTSQTQLDTGMAESSSSCDWAQRTAALSSAKEHSIGFSEQDEIVTFTQWPTMLQERRPSVVTFRTLPSADIFVSQHTIDLQARNGFCELSSLSRTTNRQREPSCTYSNIHSASQHSLSCCTVSQSMASSRDDFGVHPSFSCPARPQSPHGYIWDAPPPRKGVFHSILKFLLPPRSCSMASNDTAMIPAERGSGKSRSKTRGSGARKRSSFEYVSRRMGMVRHSSSSTAKLQHASRSMSVPNDMMRSRSCRRIDATIAEDDEGPSSNAHAAVIDAHAARDTSAKAEKARKQRRPMADDSVHQCCWPSRRTSKQSL